MFLTKYFTCYAINPQINMITTGLFYTILIINDLQLNSQDVLTIKLPSTIR